MKKLLEENYQFMVNSGLITLDTSKRNDFDLLQNL